MPEDSAAPAEQKPAPEPTPAEVLAQVEAALRQDAAVPKMSAKERIAALEQALQIARDLHSVAASEAGALDAKVQKLEADHRRAIQMQPTEAPHAVLGGKRVSL
jgi:hypothetical protein